MAQDEALAPAVPTARANLLYVSALMIPGILTLIPNHILVRNLGWITTFQGIVAPAILISPFAVFFLRQFFLGINHEVEEAAMPAGTSLAGIYWRRERARVDRRIERLPLANAAGRRGLGRLDGRRGVEHLAKRAVVHHSRTPGDQLDPILRLQIRAVAPGGGLPMTRR